MYEDHKSLHLSRIQRRQSQRLSLWYQTEWLRIQTSLLWLSLIQDSQITDISYIFSSMQCFVMTDMMTMYSHFHFGMGLKSCLPSRHRPVECREDCSCPPYCWVNSMTWIKRKRINNQYRPTEIQIHIDTLTASLTFGNPSMSPEPVIRNKKNTASLTLSNSQQPAANSLSVQDIQHVYKQPASNGL